MPAAGGHRLTLEEVPERAVGAAAEVRAERGVAGGWRHDEARVREHRGHALGVLDWRAHVVLALEQEHGHVGQRAWAELRRQRGARPALAQIKNVARQRRAAVERLELAVRDRGRPGRSLPVPLARVGGRDASPRQRCLLARRCRVERGTEHARRWRLGVDHECAPAQPQERREIAPQRSAHGPGEGRAQRWVEVAAKQDREQVDAGQALRPRPAAPVDHPTAHRAARQAIHEGLKVGHRIPRPGALRAAEGPQRTRHGVECVEVERVRAIHLDYRVEHEAVDPRGVTKRVAECHLRPVRSPVQGHLLRAELLPQGVDVVGRVAAGVEGPARPKPPRAGGGRVAGIEEIGLARAGGSGATPSARCRAGRRSPGRGSDRAGRAGPARCRTHPTPTGPARRRARRRVAAWGRRAGARAPSTRTARRGRARCRCGRAAQTCDRT